MKSIIHARWQVVKSASELKKLLNKLGTTAELALGYPGYNGRMPFENGMLSEILKEQGYNAFAISKWHLSPSEDASAAGPFNRWPLGRGFERFYGFLPGETSQMSGFNARLVHRPRILAHRPRRTIRSYRGPTGHIAGDRADHVCYDTDCLFKVW